MTQQTKPDCWVGAYRNPAPGITNDDIKREFLAAGFTIKPGHDDLKPYVYDAARRILALAAQQAAQPVAGEPVAWSPDLTYPGYAQTRVWANGAPQQRDIDYWAKQGLGITLAYTAAPAPVGLVPLPDEMMAQCRRECDDDYTKRGIFISGWLGAEAAHGIKAGKDGEK